MFNLKQIYDYHEKTNNNVPFFPLVLNGTNLYKFEKPYSENFKKFDMLSVFKYNSRLFSFESDDIVNTYDFFRNLSESYILQNADMYEKAYNVLMADYEPLYNTDKHSVIEETHIGDLLIKSGIEKDSLSKNGTETDTLSKNGIETDSFSKYGNETNTSTKNGTETDTLIKNGTETDSLTKTGSESEVITNGSHSDVLKKSVSPDNSETYFNSEKEDNNYGEQINNTGKTFDNRKDENVKTFNNRSDTNTKQVTNMIDENVLSFSTDRKDENVKTFSDRVDENVKSFSNRVDENVKTFSDRKDSTNYTITTKEDSKGNIGVKSSTELMLEEYRARMILNFYNQLFKDLIFELTF